jgi:hypothetical protein
LETLTAQAVGYACGDAVLIRDRYSRLGAATGAASILHGCFLALASGLIEGAEGMASRSLAVGIGRSTIGHAQCGRD